MTNPESAELFDTLTLRQIIKLFLDSGRRYVVLQEEGSDVVIKVYKDEPREPRER